MDAYVSTISWQFAISNYNAVRLRATNDKLLRIREAIPWNYDFIWRAGQGRPGREQGSKEQGAVGLPAPTRAGAGHDRMEHKEWTGNQANDEPKIMPWPHPNQLWSLNWHLKWGEPRRRGRVNTFLSVRLFNFDLIRRPVQNSLFSGAECECDCDCECECECHPYGWTTVIKITQRKLFCHHL